jgi:probable F420-dependent oxidoreductase
MSTVDEARAALGPVGMYVPNPFTRSIPIDRQCEAARRLERAGYRTVWTNEAVGGKDVFTQLAILMAATERVTFATGIANIWARPAQTAHGAAALLAQAYPGRFVLALGVGYPEQAQAVGREFGNPVATLRAYLDGMAEPPQLPAPDVAYPRLIAANGPKMLALAGSHTDGAFPAGKPPEFTADARKALGPDKLIVVGMGMDADAKPDETAALIRAQLDAGADHVTIFPPNGEDFEADVDHLAGLAPALTALG